MARVMMISDTHFGHKAIAKYRKEFGSMEEHDTFLLDSILSSTTKRDVLWILGDVCFDTNVFNSHFLKIVKHVNRVKIIAGNHDFERSGTPSVQDYLNAGVEVYGMVKYKYAWLTHSPMHEVELRGKINIHGHVHYNTVNDSRYVNVCCEAVNYKPINYQQILEMRKE
jgi:calcineurin-like phosphoesterase family protein